MLADSANSLSAAEGTEVAGAAGAGAAPQERGSPRAAVPGVSGTGEARDQSHLCSKVTDFCP